MGRVPAPLSCSVEQFCAGQCPEYSAFASTLQDFTDACKLAAKAAAVAPAKNFRPQDALRQQAARDYDAVELSNWWNELLDQRHSLCESLMHARAVVRAGAPCHSVQRAQVARVSDELFRKLHDQLVQAHTHLSAVQCAADAPRLDVLSRVAGSKQAIPKGRDGGKARPPTWFHSAVAAPALTPVVGGPGPRTDVAALPLGSHSEAAHNLQDAEALPSASSLFPSLEAPPQRPADRRAAADNGQHKHHNAPPRHAHGQSRPEVTVKSGYGEIDPQFWRGAAPDLEVVSGASILGRDLRFCETAAASLSEVNFPPGAANRHHQRQQLRQLQDNGWNSLAPAAEEEESATQLPQPQQFPETVPGWALSLTKLDQG